MSPNQTEFKSAILSVSQIKRKFKELTQEDMIELMIDVVKSDKDIQSFVSIKLQGEHAIIQLFEDCKQKIYTEFYPTRGLPKLRVANVEKAFYDMKNVGKCCIINT